jgi:hypothetical protein
MFVVVIEAYEVHCFELLLACISNIYVLEGNKELLGRIALFELLKLII